jgi:hypothetical protein
MYLLGDDQTIRPDQSMGWNMAAPSDPPPQLTEHESFIDRQFDSYESFHETGNRHAIPGNSEVENLEEFIERIEGEAATSYGRVDDGLSFPYDRLDLLDDRELMRSPLREAAAFNGSNDTATLSSGGRLLFEADLSGPVPLSDTFAQTANPTYPGSLSRLEPSHLEELGECLARPWRQGEML